MPVATWDAIASHGPEQGVKSAGLRAEEVPRGVMGRSCLGDLTVWARLDSMD
jgi:hypothetical protein